MARRGSAIAATVGTVVAFLVLFGFWSWPAMRAATAQSEVVGQPIADPRALVGGAVQEVPSGVFDGVDPDRIPGIVPLEDAPPEVQERIWDLAAAYDRAADRSSQKSLSLKIAQPPDNPAGPPRMDSGDPNPDRVVGAADAGREGRGIGVSR
jgi:hypothetical protein